MLRLFCNALRNPATAGVRSISAIPRVVFNAQQKAFGTFNYKPVVTIPGIKNIPCQSILLNPKINEIASQIVPVRSIIKFSLQKGKKKSCKAVVKRFFRLQWGGWIRTRAGRHKKIWKKSPPLQRKLRQHIFCNSTQSYLLDKMVCNVWRKPKYYVDDPYAPYHTREEYRITRRKPVACD